MILQGGHFEDCCCQTQFKNDPPIIIEDPGRPPIVFPGRKTKPVYPEKIPICEIGWTLIDGKCVKDGKTTEPVCEKGWKLINGMCIRNPCDKGWHEENGVCVKDDEGSVVQAPLPIVVCSSTMPFDLFRFKRHSTPYDALIPGASVGGDNHISVQTWVSTNVLLNGRSILTTNKNNYVSKELTMSILRHFAGTSGGGFLFNQIQPLLWASFNNQALPFWTDKGNFGWKFNGLGGVEITNLVLDAVHVPYVTACWVDNWPTKDLVSFKVVWFTTWWGYSSTEIVTFELPKVVPPDIIKEWEDHLKPDPIEPETDGDPVLDPPDDDPIVTDPTGEVDKLSLPEDSKHIIMNNPDFPLETRVLWEDFTNWYDIKYKNKSKAEIPKAYWNMRRHDPTTWMLFNSNSFDIPEDSAKEYLH